MTYSTFFIDRNGFPPHSWQDQLGRITVCRDLLIRAGTGLGKTTGVASAWFYNRCERGDLSWPTRLVWVLPMRTLVEQTLTALEELVGPDVPVVPCMGGLVDKEYALRPDRPTILVGTQDMLVSRALNRGYAAARGRWPIDFGLLSRDTLFVCDEIQLMDAALPTTAQLAAFRRTEGLRPAHTWWMSATLQPEWLETVDHSPHVGELRDSAISVPVAEQTGGIWDNEKNLVRRDDLSDERSLAKAVAERHRPGSLTLVIVNRVDRAVNVYKRLGKATGAEVMLIHSRFRPGERKAWTGPDGILRRDAPVPEAGRIIVATQVVEAGVDISADLLVTDLAPWASLVQRFGRAARYAGNMAEVWVGSVPEKDNDALPYELSALQSADQALNDLDAGVGLGALEAFERTLSPERLATLYPTPDTAILRKRDLLQLFDTTADLSGADLDVGPFIRSGSDRDLQVFWRDDVAEDAPPTKMLLPHRDELCRVSLGKKTNSWLAEKTWWIHDYSDGWVKGTKRTRLSPGRLVLLTADSGGYDTDRGLDFKSKRLVPVVDTSPAEDAFERAAATESSEALSAVPGWRTISTHCRETADQVLQTAQRLELPPRLAELLSLAARWHDVGKAHPVFQGMLKSHARSRLESPERIDLAKGPTDAWGRSERRGFRHELASALAMFALLRRAQPEHPALRGGVAEALDAMGWSDDLVPDLQEHPLAQELMALTASEFDLVAWLVVTHHGKVRSSWASTLRDQQSALDSDDPTQIRIHGLHHEESLPAVPIAGPDGTVEIPPLVLDLSPARLGLNRRFGRSWSERAQALLDDHGPFDLAYLEALLRAADATASQLTSTDPEVTLASS